MPITTIKPFVEILIATIFPIMGIIIINPITTVKPVVKILILLFTV